MEIDTFKELINNFQIRSERSNNIYIFSFCWLMSVLLFFSFSATKLPSYWIPAVPAASILITFLISSPWYVLQFLNKGNIFLDNFFGYHNLRRYTSVVNNHAESWWFYFFILIVASLPFSIFLIHGD